MRIIGSLLSALVCFAVSVSGYTTVTDPSPARSYKAVFIQTATKNGGDAHIEAVKLHWVRSTGEWQELTIWTADPTGHVFARRESGHQAPHTSASTLLAPRIPPELLEKFRSAQYLRESRDFVRKDRVLGFTTFVWLVSAETGMMEVHYSPALGSTPIKTVWTEGDSQVVDEAVQIEFLRDVTNQVVTAPLRPDVITPLVEQREAMGDTAGARTLRRMKETLEERIRRGR